MTDHQNSSAASGGDWAPCDACPSPKFCRHHKVTGCQGSWNPVLKQYPLHYHEGWHDGFEAALTECPRPVLPDHSAKACVESGNCGCGAQSPAPAQPAPVTVEEIAKLVDPVAHEMYDAAYAAKDWPDQMTWIKRLEASREKAGNILFRLNPPPAATVEERQVSCAPGGQPYAKAHECSSAGSVAQVLREARRFIANDPTRMPPSAMLARINEALATLDQPQPLSVPWTGNLSMDLRKTPVHVRAEGVPLIDEAGVCWAVVFPDKSGFYDHGSAIVSALSRPHGGGK